MDKEGIEKVLEMGAEGFLNEYLELKSNLKALAHSITDMIEQSPVSRIAGFSAVVCMTSAGSIDTLALCGVEKGIRFAAKHIIDTLDDNLSSVKGMSKGEKRIVEDSERKSVTKVS